MLDLSCSVSGVAVANFTIQKEKTVLSQYQNYSKIAEERDSGLYSCTAGIDKVVKRSGLVPVQVCGEYTLSCSDVRRLCRDKECEGQLSPVTKADGIQTG